MNYKIDVTELKEKAHGRWFEIFKALDSRLIPAINSGGAHVACPLGSGDIDGFRIPKDGYIKGNAYHNQYENKKLSDGIGVLCWLNDWNFYECLKNINDYLDSGLSSLQNGAPTIRPALPDNKKKIHAVKTILKEAKVQINEPARLYYSSRGLDEIEGALFRSIGYHESVRVYNGKNAVLDHNGKYLSLPVIVSKMTDSRGVTGIHLTRLTPCGEKAGEYINDLLYKTGFSQPKRDLSKVLLKTVDKMTGSAIRFGVAGDTLNVGEGLETMLGIALELKTNSVAAACTAAMLENMEIPDQVKTLNIWADKDRSGRGLKAAEALYNSLKDRMNVNIYIPPLSIPEGSKGLDWLDCRQHVNEITD